MLSRLLAFAGLLLASGCAYDAGYVETNYASQPGSTAGYYRNVQYTTPYLPDSPVYQSPYLGGPVMGGIYVSGDDRDIFGGPIFSPFHGIRCDRRRHLCWDQNGPDPRWTGRFFGYRYSNWGNGGWGHGGWHHNNGGGNQGGGNGPGPNTPNPWPNPGPNPGNQPWVYQVPENPDGSGTPTFMPNCGGAGQPPC